MRSISDLAVWQRGFVTRYLAVNPPKALLVAAPGSGKTITSVVIAHELMKRGDCDSLLVFTDRLELCEQWAHVAEKQGISISSREFSHQGAAVTLQSLTNQRKLDKIKSAIETRRPIAVIDETHRSLPTQDILTRVVGTQSTSRLLFIGEKYDAALFRGYAYSFALGELTPAQPIAKGQILQPSSPSFELIQRLIRGKISLDELSWRAFEKLIAELLEADGYDIELMRGTKDGGVDVIATKELGPVGLFRSLWQAKKYSKNKVGLSAVRELADTRAEHKASKGVLVTSTFLTKGALERIERESFLLGKVDRNDLSIWLMRYAYGNWRP